MTNVVSVMMCGILICGFFWSGVLECGSVVAFVERSVDVAL